LTTLADIGWMPIAAAVATALAWWGLAARAAPAASGDADMFAAAPPHRDELPRWPIAVAVALAAIVLVIFLDEPAIAASGVTLVAGGFLILRTRARTRRAVERERDAIEAIGTASRALRAGIPMAGMLEILATECHGEARLAFREILRREGLGEELGSAIRRTLLRSSVPALRAFGLALIVQLGAGGNLADTTDRLARSLVERGRVRRRARTIVTYSRSAATVLAILPFIAVPMMCWMVDGYANLLFRRPEGQLFLGISALLLAVGLASIQRLGRIETGREGRAA